MPTQMNSKALNIAWVSKWKRVSSGLCRPRAMNIRPNWLKVDKATIFFRSVSTIAATPADIMVIVPKISIRGGAHGSRVRVSWSRMRR